MHAKTRRKRQNSEFARNFDLRSQKVNGRYIVGPIKNQGNCACCWGFAVTAMLETIYAVNVGKFKSFSDQEMCDCATDGTTAGCAGGGLMWGVEYAINSGLASEFDYHEFDQNRATRAGTCEAMDDDKTFPPRKLDYHFIRPENAESEIIEILNTWKTPVAVSGTVWHAGAIVGYGEENDLRGRSQRFWIMKNSWGESGWSTDGYVKLIRGKNWCGIERGAIGANMEEHYHG